MHCVFSKVDPLISVKHGNWVFRGLEVVDIVRQ